MYFLININHLNRTSPVLSMQGVVLFKTGVYG